MKWMNVLWLWALALITLLTGCGGGSGGGPVTYEITLRADRTNLPLNIGFEGPMIGGRYTTTLFVEAKDSLGRPIPGGEDIFGCNINGGLDSGSLYYLDGDDEHETTETIDGVEFTFPNAYRAVTLPSNAGGASFHLHAGEVAGTVIVTCTVTEAGSGIQRSAQVSVQIGGSPSGKVSQIVFDTISPNLLFVQGMNGDTQTQIQANVVDEAGQVVNPPAGANDMQVRIVPSSSTLADNDATLRGVNASGQAVAGSSIHIRSINGKAQFTLVSGTNPGGILIEAVSDRADNNVGNGIGEPIFNLASVTVIDEVPTTPPSSEPLAITTTTLLAATANVPYGQLLEASGGTPPYTWSLVSGTINNLSNLGLTLSSSGVISGVPGASPNSGVYSFVVQVTDASGAKVQKALTISYTAAAPTPTTPPEPTAPTITTASPLSDGQVGQSYISVLTASGGTTPYVWSAVGLPSGLTMNVNGVISGTPTAAGDYVFAVTVTGGSLSSTVIFNITIDPATDALTIMTTSVPSGKKDTAYGPIQLSAVGGDTTNYAWSVDQLPTGLNLAPLTGVISGTPTATVTNFIFTVTLTDGVDTVSRDYSITIAP